MDFQSRQHEAQVGTSRLVAVLVVGIVAIVAVVSALLMLVFSATARDPQPLVALAIALPATILTVGGASLFKSSQLRRGGGTAIARSLGGRPVEAESVDPTDRQLLNLVEEIAIASGQRTPAVFVLDDEPSINAFAAGWEPEDAIIGVTGGALTHLDRRELQGVIGHEMSHIGNRDTQVKTRIVGWVFGIAALAIIGRVMLAGSFFGGRRRGRQGDSGTVLVLAGLGLLIVGSVGVLFGQLIQAAVSRQREYLADASAVQYTRDPSALGDALLKIGAAGSGNRMRSPHATETSHLFFSEAVGAAFASHPPLEDRILRLLPDWDGTFPDLEVPLESVAADQRSSNRARREPIGGPWGLRPPPPGHRPPPRW